jgi:hypothetical protein
MQKRNLYEDFLYLLFVVFKNLIVVSRCLFSRAALSFPIQYDLIIKAAILIQSIEYIFFNFISLMLSFAEFLNWEVKKKLV